MYYNCSYGNHNNRLKGQVWWTERLQTWNILCEESFILLNRIIINYS